MLPASVFVGVLGTSAELMLILLCRSGLEVEVAALKNAMMRPQLLVSVNIGLITATLLLLLLHIATRGITRSYLSRLSMNFDFVDAL